MDYSQFLLMKEELSLIAVIVILFIADLFMSPDAHKHDGKPMLNTSAACCPAHRPYAYNHRSQSQPTLSAGCTITSRYRVSSNPFSA